MIQIDIEMPTNCYDCWFRQNMGCRIADGSGWLNNQRDDDCQLKAQEPVEPIIETHWETPSVYDEDVRVTENKCGACGTEIDKWDKFCKVCGRAVKWE